MHSYVSIEDFKRFHPYVVANAPLLKLCGGFMWTEGPVYFPAMELERCCVFRIDPTLGTITIPTVKPNGLTFSSDEGTLYVAESGTFHDPEDPREITAFDLAENGGHDANIAPGIPEGFRVGDLLGLCRDAWTACVAPRIVELYMLH